MRTRGLSGPFFKNHFGMPKLSKSIGAAYSPGGALSTPAEVPLAALIDSTTSDPLVDSTTLDYLVES